MSHLRNLATAHLNGGQHGRRFAISPSTYTVAVRTPINTIKSYLLFLYRCLRLLLHVVVGLGLASLINLDFTQRIDADDWSRRWLRRLMRIVGVKFVVHGQPISGGQVIVCNHVSWLDIPLVGAALTARFVAKSDIQHWPVAGWLARACGTFYIRRGTGGSKPLLDKLRPHLVGGGSVVIFPEGTTTRGHDVLPFHTRLFEAAVEAQCVVQPVALRYGLSKEGHDIAPFIDDDTLVAHIVRLLRSSGLTAELTYCEPLAPGLGYDRQILAQLAEDAIHRVVVPEPAFKTPALVELHERMPA